MVSYYSTRNLEKRTAKLTCLLSAWETLLSTVRGGESVRATQLGMTHIAKGVGGGGMGNSSCPFQGVCPPSIAYLCGVLSCNGVGCSCLGSQDEVPGGVLNRQVLSVCSSSTLCILF